MRACNPATGILSTEFIDQGFETPPPGFHKGRYDHAQSIARSQKLVMFRM
jgi:hypothetical protein